MPAVAENVQKTRRPVLVGVSALFLGLVMAVALGIHFSGPARYVPFLASLIFFGLPHGALDHLVATRLANQRATVLSILRVVLLYLVLGSAVIALWFAAPAIAAIAFIALTWYHWGQGDLFALLAFTQATYLQSRRLRALALIVRGGLPMLVPLIAWPELYKNVLVSAAGLFATGSSSTAGTSAGGPQFDWITLPATRITVGLIFGTLVFTYLALSMRAADASNLHAWRMDAAETVLLTLFFMLVSPILAVGLYFSLWHALRHILRLGQLNGGTARGSASARRAIRGSASARRAIGGSASARPLLQFAREAAPFTAVSLAILAALYCAVPHSNSTASSLLGLYLVLLSALTLPHVVIVTWMDARQKVWL